MKNSWVRYQISKICWYAYRKCTFHVHRQVTQELGVSGTFHGLQLRDYLAKDRRPWPRVFLPFMAGQALLRAWVSLGIGLIKPLLDICFFLGGWGEGTLGGFGWLAMNMRNVGWKANDGWEYDGLCEICCHYIGSQLITVPWNKR